MDVKAHCQEAMRIDEDKYHIAGADEVRVRVPGHLVKECKQAGDDTEPCLLVEAYYWSTINRPHRFLCYRVDFHESSSIIQNVADPHPDNGAIIWVETNGPVTLYGRDET